jgi:hypothetical protein
MGMYLFKGNHWLNEIIPRLLQSTLDSTHELANTFLEDMPDLTDLNTMASPRVMTTHLPYKYLPKEHKENHGKIIHIIRNPKDVVVSAFHFFNVNKWVTDYICPEWSGFFEDFLYDGRFNLL